MPRFPSFTIGGSLAQLLALVDDAASAAWEPFVDEDDLLDSQLAAVGGGIGEPAAGS